MKHAVLTTLLVVLCSIILQAQTPQPSKPGPESKKLGMFLGTWSAEMDFKPGNGYGAPAGKVNVTERYQWLQGEFFLQMNRDGKRASGEVVREMIILGYDPGAKKYSGAWYDLGSGASSPATLTNSGNTWTWTEKGSAPDGKTFQERCTIAVVPNMSYTVKCDTSPDGKSWTPALEAKATKAKN